MYTEICQTNLGKIAKGSNKIHFTMLYGNYCYIFIENFMEIFTTLNVVIWFSTGTLGIFATVVYVFTMRVL